MSHKYYFPACIAVALQDHFSLKRLLSSVDPPMIGKRSFLPKLLFASITTIRLLSSVDPHMPAKMTFKSKLFITHIILIRHFSRVHSQMIYRTFFGCNLLMPAKLTFLQTSHCIYWLLSSVDSHMHDKDTFNYKLLIANITLI